MNQSAQSQSSLHQVQAQQAPPPPAQPAQVSIPAAPPAAPPTFDPSTAQALGISVSEMQAYAQAAGIGAQLVGQAIGAGVREASRPSWNKAAGRFVDGAAGAAGVFTVAGVIAGVAWVAGAFSTTAE